MDEHVRPLTEADCADVADLEAAARAAMADQRGGAVRLGELPAVGDWRPLVGEPVWVATIDGAVVGYLQLSVHGPVAEVMQVYVHPEARELGLGDSLLATAVQSATSLGCTRFEGTALPGDRDTKNLYERAHIVARKIVVSRPL